MASLEEMCEVSPDDVTPDALKVEMDQCEKMAEGEQWEASIDEVFTQPDINRTTFIWQIEMADDSDAEDEWEKQDSAWRCLPQHWQNILNSRLAQHQSTVQDAQALYQQRLEAYGPNDVKTKNAEKKVADLEAGKNSVSVVLMVKASGKEAGPEIYRRCVQNQQGELKINVSNYVAAYKFCVETLKLVTLKDPPIEKQLRLVSVSGLSREIQEVRLHLDLLSLSSSKVIDTFAGKAPKASSSSSSGQGAAVASEKEVQQELQALDQGGDEFEAAEEGMMEGVESSGLAIVANPEVEAQVLGGCY